MQAREHAAVPAGDVRLPGRSERMKESFGRKAGPARTGHCVGEGGWNPRVTAAAAGPEWWKRLVFQAKAGVRRSDSWDIIGGLYRALIPTVGICCQQVRRNHLLVVRT
jgi:hypothetical protein